MTPGGPLAGRRAVVTGGATGIGRATCRWLARDGAAVVVDYIGEAQPAERLVRGIERQGGEAVAIEADVTSEDAVGELFRAARARFGATPDILVNSAGIQTQFALLDMELGEWQKVLDVNLTGAFLCARDFARGLVEAELPGVIVNVSSVHEQVPWPTYSHYCASKGGLKLFTGTIARELAEHGIRVVSVGPGAILTPINKELAEDQGKRDAVLEQIPLGRIGEPEEIASAIAWLAGDGAAYITGTTLFVDGGMTQYPGVKP